MKEKAKSEELTAKEKQKLEIEKKRELEIEEKQILKSVELKYDQKKRKNKSKAQAHHGRTKEIRIRPKTGQHDIDFKINHAREFLEHKDKVTVSVIFRGRELAHIDEGRRVLNNFISELDDIAKVEMPPSQHGRRIVCILVPK